MIGWWVGAFMITVDGMKSRSGKQRGRRDRGPGGRPSRPRPSNDTPATRDPETDVEVEMSRSGRTKLGRKEATLGAQRTRRSRSTSDGRASAGSEVAPTAKAEVRERERHRLQREQGVVPAGEEGNLRQRRGPKATRASLDAAARQADRHAH